MKISPENISSFQAFIFSWWTHNRRDLPWRRTRDPYRILVSEIMLQQTQVSRVIPKYEEFLSLFPTAQSLASAETARVLRVWKGMGYNRRALYLKKTAQAIMEHFQGRFPESESELVKLPGLGKYTARALLVFAFSKEVGAIDTNIRKIITHFFYDDIPQAEREIEKTARKLIPKGKAWEWHQALMDFGALELPKLKKRGTSGTGKKKIPFRESNRFFRGRIVDALRERSTKESQLVNNFVRMYACSTELVTSILDSLEKDALIVRKRGVVSLP